MSRRLRFAIALLAAVPAGCARPVPPSGGPEDTSPPAVVSVRPDSLATGVAVDAAVSVTFTEKIEADRLDDAIWIRPHNIIRGVSTDGPTATIRLRHPFPDSTTVGVVITTVARDRRGNAMAAPYQWVFSTGPAIAPGRVYGTVEQIGTGAARGQTLVALVPTAGDTLPDPNVVDPVAVTQAGPGGDFDLPGLVPDGRVYLLYAMVDRNEDRIVGGPGEFHTAVPESVRITPDAPVREVGLKLIDPEAPATVQGKLERAAGDSVAVVVELLGAEDDSLGTVTARATVRPDGGFSLSRVPAGVYRLEAVCDTSGNGAREPEEPWLSVRANIQVPAGLTLDLGDLPGPRCNPEAAGREEP